MSTGLRTVLALAVAVVLLGSYVWFRSKSLEPSQSTAGSGSPSVSVPQNQGGSRGLQPQSVCIRPETQTGPPHQFTLRGGIRVPHLQSSTPEKAVTLVVLADTPLDQWSEAERVTVHDVAGVAGETLDVVLTAHAPQAHACVLRTDSYQEFASVLAGACVAEPVVADTVTDVDLSLEKAAAMELTGVTGLIPGGAWPTVEQRTIEGTVSAPGLQTARFLVVVASEPILDEPDTEADPSALAATGADGRFELSYLSEPSEASWVCAMGFPPTGPEPAQEAEPSGVGCVEAVEGPVTITLDPLVRYPISPEEKGHFAFLADCL